MLASGPFPFYYGYGPADAAGPADPLLATFGIPIRVREPARHHHHAADTNQTILQSIPASSPFPSGDQRLRAITVSGINPANRYQSFITAQGSDGINYGDAGGFFWCSGRAAQKMARSCMSGARCSRRRRVRPSWATS